MTPDQSPADEYREIAGRFTSLVDDVLRTRGQYGARVDVPADADPQTRLLAFIGRDPLRGGP